MWCGCPEKGNIIKSNVALMVFGLSDFHSGKVISELLRCTCLFFATALIGFPLIWNATRQCWSKFDAVLITAGSAGFSIMWRHC